jgi:hypothetical protein
VQQGEQEVRHARASVGQTSGATQRCLYLGFSERIENSRPTGFNNQMFDDRSSRRLRCRPSATLFTYAQERTRSEDYCRQTEDDEDFHAGARIPQRAGRPPAPSLDTAGASLWAYRWRPHCRGLYHTPMAA